MQDLHFFIFFCNRPALSSDKALGFTTWSLHQCCRAQYSHPIYRVAEKANLDLCLQRIPMQGSAAGTATPKQPKKFRDSRIQQGFTEVPICAVS